VTERLDDAGNGTSNQIGGTQIKPVVHRSSSQCWIEEPPSQRLTEPSQQRVDTGSMQPLTSTKKKTKKRKIDLERRLTGTSAMPGMRRRENLTLILPLYHIMNSTCIHLRAKVLNIYMYRSGRIYKEPPGEIQ
jgi:hypothetical protein